MRFVIQRVTNASIVIDSKTESSIQRSINQGYVILMGIHKTDDASGLDHWVQKILKLRVFADEHKPINASIQDINGDILLVSQFTLYADTKGQNRPSFTEAAPPDIAKNLYDEFVKKLKSAWSQTVTGEFGADMKVTLTNDGPVTIILES